MAWREAARTLAVDFARVAIVSAADWVRRFELGEAAKSFLGVKRKVLSLTGTVPAVRIIPQFCPIKSCEVKLSRGGSSLGIQCFIFLCGLLTGACVVLLFSRERFGQQPEPVVGRPVKVIVPRRTGRGSAVVEDECSSSS